MDYLTLIEMQVNNDCLVPLKTYTIGLWPELGGFVFRISADGKHGLVSETVDQSTDSTWFAAQNSFNFPENHSKDGQNFKDWRLPTLFELDEMYTARVAIGNFDLYYWSSTENVLTKAYFFNFFNGNNNYASKPNTFSVRGVRAF